jgi:hypothetical protein
LGKSLIKEGNMRDAINFLGQIDYLNYDLKGLELLARGHHGLGGLRESVKAYLRLI